MRALKLILGICLLPLCWVATRTFISLLAALAEGGGVSRDVWALLIGLVGWLVLFVATPRPVRTYVLAHELTHALWALLMGARVSRLRVSGKGGSVQVSRTNFLITLAPYFFPFYTVLTVATHLALSLFHDLSVYRPFWFGLVGLTYGFHLCFTATTLAQHQTDVQENGRLFSYALIYLLNVLGLSACVIAVGAISVEHALLLWGAHMQEALQALSAAADRLRALWPDSAAPGDPVLTGNDK